jgi:hypothetical protein
VSPGARLAAVGDGVEKEGVLCRLGRLRSRTGPLLAGPV